VGIHSQNRPSEFTPAPLNPQTADDWGGTQVEKAALLEAHLRDEVYPLLCKNYRTGTLQFGVGQSLGGTFVTQSMLYERGLFNAVISISPIWRMVMSSSAVRFNLH
jgi:predicted alpha/beta superfamily hydrolase